MHSELTKKETGMKNEIKLYENKGIRSVWDEEKEEWYFSVVDVVGVLSESKNARRYWSDLKRKIKDEEGGIQLYENIVQLKLESADGKKYLTDVADLQGIFRIIQSIPSPKAEPFKMWLAEVGKERVDEVIDPELIIDRALETYLKKGYSREWIHQRLQAIQVRKEAAYKSRLLLQAAFKKLISLRFLVHIGSNCKTRLTFAIASNYRRLGRSRSNKGCGICLAH